MNPFFPEIKKNFGFGCMRLPMKDGHVVYEEFSRMIDEFIAKGFNYFDTAHGYLDGKSEIAIHDCLSSRYPRDSFILTDKLSDNFFQAEEDIRPFFESQLKICGVEYFDFYLMHAQNGQNFEKYKRCRAYETAFALKAEGKIRHVGISFHDSAEVLDRILTQYPQIEAVQLQFNYLDYEDPRVQSRQCYEVCVKHGKPVIVMEPVKGGRLAELPEEGKRLLDELGDLSPASYAIRFAAGFDNVMMVLSGMSTVEQMEDNLRFMQDFRKLDSGELAAVAKVCGCFRALDLIPCTACRYCTERCPNSIPIPELFACLNAGRAFHDRKADSFYRDIIAKNGVGPSDCVKCGLCEAACPQHLNIRELLEAVSEAFENRKLII